ncbi:hypothetical protein GUJ93_ZPchr0004g39421 [Zizania palustris]|uniref:Uncharacterized protein n=1 Tax=Zizania palustris TaxID=103762 RepID=A0A8J5VZC2_ZIZPA|nr:hypothetical protein GUJ93_ZPchr0004g39421 [Zizania palustris]
MERRVGDLRAVVSSVPPAVAAANAPLTCKCEAVVNLHRTLDHIHDIDVPLAIMYEHSGQPSKAWAIKIRTTWDVWNRSIASTFKIDEGTSTAQVFGKEYRLATVRLTKEQQAMHQKRSHTYQWKRPTVFVKEGDSLPPDVDPDTMRLEASDNVTKFSSDPSKYAA